MRNSIIVTISTVILAFSLVASLIFMYVDLEYGFTAVTQMRYGAYIYLIGMIVSGLLFFAISNVGRGLKIYLNSIVSLFFIFSVLLSLITIYSSPTEKPETIIGAIFYSSGLTLVALYIFSNNKTNNVVPNNLTTIHKIVRYLIYATILFFVLRAIYGLILLVNTFSKL